MAGHLKRSFEATSESLEPPRKRQRVLSRGQIAKRARETELKNFLLDLPEYAPTVPAESTRFFLRNGGLSTANDQIVILMSLAVDHVMANIVKDCQLSRLLRLERTEEKEAEKFEGGEMLTGEDLAMSLGQRGIDVQDSGTIVRSAGTARRNAGR
ncbi:unnamed protein product [Ascophyllum nodosum]